MSLQSREFTVTPIKHMTDETHCISLEAEMDIASSLAATGNAISILKAIRDADAAIDTATLKGKLAEVMNELSDARLGQLEMLENIRELKEEVDRLRSSDRDIAELIGEAGYKYRKDENGTAAGWPACPKCLVKDKIVTILVQDGDIQNAKCPRCDSGFKPVTCFVGSGRTAVQHRNEERVRKSAEMNARIDRLNHNSWMA